METLWAARYWELLMDFFCCNMPVTIHKIGRCNGGDQIVATWDILGYIERDLGFTTSGLNQQNTAASVLYIDGSEPFLQTEKMNLSGYYVHYDFNGADEFYRIDRFSEAYDPICCKINHYEAEMTRVKKPEACNV